MSQSTTTRPNAVGTVGGAWTGSAADLADNSDSTGVQNVVANSGNRINIAFASFSVPTGAQVRSVTPRIRYVCGASSQGVAFALYDGVNTGAFTNSAAGTISLVTVSGNTATSTPSGAPLTQTTLNSLQIQVYAPDALAAVVVKEAYLDIVYNLAPTATGNALGTITATQAPPITWAYSDSDGDIQERFVVKVFTAAQYGAGGFDPNTSSPYAISGVTRTTITGSETYSAAVSWTPDTALPNGTYRAFIFVADAGSNGRYNTVTSAGPYTSFTIAVTQPAIPSIVATSDPTNARVALALQDFQNLLSADDASFETGQGTWQSVANSTLQRSAPAQDGSTSLNLKSAAAGTYSAGTNTGTSAYGVLPSTQYTFMAYVRAAAVARSVTVQVQWYKSNGTTTGGVVSGTPVTTNTSTFVQILCVATSPSDAAFAQIIVSAAGAAGTNEIQYVDACGIFIGNISTWTPGGFNSLARFEVQYSTDAGTTFTTITRLYVSGTTVSDLSTTDYSDISEALTAYWYEAPRAVSIQYRVRTKVTIGSNTLLSDWSSVSTVTLTISATDLTWKFKVLTNPTLNYAFDCKATGEFWDRTSQEQAAFFNPIGRSRSVKVTDTIQGDIFDLTVMCTLQAAADAYVAIRAKQAVILLQSPDGRQWYTAFQNSVKASDVLVATPFYREYSATFEEQDAPA